MSGLHHINLVTLFGISINPLRMTMEWCGEGDLFHLIHSEEKSSKVTWKMRYKIALNIARGMEYLQNVTPPIVHRDLRSPNIFLVSLNENDDVLAKVADFGLSRHVEHKLSETLPTWRWLAPEIIDFHSMYYDERSDIYSFAIICWEMIYFDIPYDEFSSVLIQDVKSSIIAGKLRPTLPDLTNPVRFPLFLHSEIFYFFYHNYLIIMLKFPLFFSRIFCNFTGYLP